MVYYCNTFFSSTLVLLSLATLAFPSVYLQLSGCQHCQSLVVQHHSTLTTPHYIPVRRSPDICLPL